MLTSGFSNCLTAAPPRFVSRNAAFPTTRHGLVDEVRLKFDVERLLDRAGLCMEVRRCLAKRPAGCAKTLEPEVDQIVEIVHPVDCTDVLHGSTLRLFDLVVQHLLVVRQPLLSLFLRNRLYREVAREIKPTGDVQKEV